MRHVAEWVRDAIQAGLGMAAVSASAIALMLLFPVFVLAYPFVLIPLLFVGPLAVRRTPGPVRRVLLGGALAGAIAGTLTVCALALASNVFGVSYFALLGASTARPMPTLPMPDLVAVLSWPQEDVLLFAPPAAALLALIYARLTFAWPLPSPYKMKEALAAAPISVRLKLGLGFMALGALTLLTGWLGFSALEDMHLRQHRVQVLTDWSMHLDELERLQDRIAALGGQSASSANPDLARLGDAQAAILTHLRDARSHDGIVASTAVSVEISQRFRPQVDALIRALERTVQGGAKSESGAADDSGTLSQMALSAVIRDLRVDVHREMAADLARTDLAHHGNLIAIMALIILALALTFAISRVLAEAITEPLGSIGAHLGRLARGDFSARLRVASRDELGHLSRELNRVTAELDRLYEIERRARTEAEEFGRREHSLAAAKEFWAHTIVHDLRGPLTIVNGFVELLVIGRLGALSGNQQHAMTEIQRAGKQMLEDVQDILDVFRLEQEAFPLDRQRIATADLLHAASVATQRPGRREVVEITADPSGMLDVYADRRLLLRALENLLQNAYKYAGEQARVSFSARAGPGDLVTLAVDDDGPGIPLEQRDNVFLQFQQGDREREGAGLGLTFCQLVAQRHDGTILVETSPLGGARFCLAVPAAAAMAEFWFDTAPGETPASLDDASLNGAATEALPAGR